MKLLLAALLLLAGCATSRELYLPDGTIGYNIQCDGSMNSPSNCFQKAGDLCQAKGYTLLNREGEMIPASTAVATRSVFLSQSGAYVSRTLFIRCNSG